MELYKSDIQKLIKVKKADTFWSHLVFSFKKDYKVYGEIETNTIKVWQRTNMTGLSYPVFIFEFNSENKLIKTTDKLNPFGQFLGLLFPLFYFYPTLSTAFTDFQIKRFFTGLAVFSFLTFICYLVFSKIYRYEKEEQLNDFYKALDIKIEDKLEKEWSISKIGTRLFTYPFCLVLIIISIFGMLPDGNFLAIFVLAFVGIYLYSDLKMIFKEKRKSD